MTDPSRTGCADRSGRHTRRDAGRTCRGIARGKVKPMHRDRSSHTIMDALRRAWAAWTPGQSITGSAKPIARRLSRLHPLSGPVLLPPRMRLDRIRRNFTARAAVLVLVGGLLPPVVVLALLVP